MYYLLNYSLRSSIYLSIYLLLTFLVLSSSVSADLVYNFDTNAGLLGTSQPYTQGGVTIIATGYDQNFSTGTVPPTALYSSTLGLGLAFVTNNAIGNPDNNDQGFVQLNLTSLLTVPSITSITATINGFTTTVGGAWQITAGSTTGNLNGTFLEENSGNITTNDLSKVLTFNPSYLNFFTAFSDTSFYLQTLTVHVAVPEPSTYLLLGSMLVLALIISWKKQKVIRLIARK